MTGLGVSTVSQALKDAPDISRATKERVRLVARQIGYRPNRAGLRLRTGKTTVIALVLNTEEGSMGLVSEMVYGISDALASTSYHLVVTPYSLSDLLEPIRYIVETGSADGIILPRQMIGVCAIWSYTICRLPPMGEPTWTLPIPTMILITRLYEAVRSMNARGRRRIARHRICCFNGTPAWD